MANAYVPPSVSVNETTTPSVAPLLGTAADVCLIGLAGNTTTTSSVVTATDIVVLSGTQPHQLPTLLALNNDSSLVAVLSVTDVLNPSVGTPLGAGYTVTTDYTVDVGEDAPDGTHGTITRVSGGTIPDGRLVAVTYTYIPGDYWNPVRLYDPGSVESRFGNAWTTATNPINGQTYYTGINSQLSMAARIAFENGAPSVICQPLFARATPGDPTTAQQAPTATQYGAVATWSDTLYNIRQVSDLNFIVPIIGQDGGVHVSDSTVLSVFGAVQSHQAYMNSLEQFIIAIFGEDGTVEGVGTNTSGLMYAMRTAHATGLQSNFANVLSCQTVLINNTVFQRPTPGGANTVINVGGQYAAAAFAGALAARSTSSSMTRKSISGFTSITDPRTSADKNADAGAGLCVIEQVNGTIRCRQSNTLDIINGVAKSELSVVRSKFLVIQSIKETLDNQIIGNIIADANSPLIVRSTVASVLSLLQGVGAILAYSAPTAALTTLNPTTIAVSFSYQPAFPVNFIHVTFSLNLSSGAVTVTSTGSNA